MRNCFSSAFQSVMHLSWDFTAGYAGEGRKHTEIVPLLLLRPHFLKQIFTLIIDGPRLQAKPSQLKDSRNKSPFVTALRDYLCYLSADLHRAASGLLVYAAECLWVLLEMTMIIIPIKCRRFSQAHSRHK